MGEMATRSRQRNISLLAGLFVALLVALTLGGNTIRSLSMPKVITSVPTAGSLDYAYEGSATVRPAAERELSNPAGWTVLEVLVKAGDTVQKGEPLVRYDDSDAQDQLAELQSSLKKLQMSLDLLQYNLKQALRGEDETAKLSSASALESTKLDIDDQKRRIEKLQTEMEASRELKAPVDGVVTAVGAATGSASTGMPDVRLADAAKGYQIRLTVPGELAARLNLGDELKSIVLADDDTRQLAGTVSAIEEASGGGADLTGGDSSGAGADVQISAPTGLLTVTLRDDGLGLQGGERVKVSIRRSESGNLLLVPNEAVHHDSKGAFVYTISAKQGPLGNAYYATETRVVTAGSNDYATAVSGGLFEQSEVIVGNSGLITSGTRVRY